MNRGHVLLGLAAAAGLFFSSSPSHAASSSGTTTKKATRAHIVRHHRSAVASLDEPALRSSAAFIFDETHHSVLYSKHADDAMPIASITKLMTTLVVLDAGQPLDETLEIADGDRAVGKGAYSRLNVGTQLSRADFIHLALMSSENRAAHTLARNYPGGVEACVRAMNAKAKALGMTSTHFSDPTGLSSENVASPEDLAKLVVAASHDPTIREYSTDSGYEVRVGRRILGFRNTDALVMNPNWNIIVQKTGYITEAGRCLVMKAVIDSRTVVIVLLNSFGKNTRVADALRVRKWMEAKLEERGSGALASKT